MIQIVWSVGWILNKVRELALELKSIVINAKPVTYIDGSRSVPVLMIISQFVEFI